uniref:SCP domain-containing protein n=1 Tax=Mesocestoides corti TaxID=53468 RepID=A0A5K3EFN5_MESCO
MLKLVCIMVLLWNVLAEVPSEKEREYIVNLHTELREEVNPPASNMLMLSYSNELETLADEWAKKCTFLYPDETFAPEYKGLGSGILSGNINQSMSFEDLSELKQEKLQFDYETNTCKKWCDFYKQAIWSMSTEIGCAKQRCLLQPSKDYIYRVVCLYRPGVGFPTALPYESGASCSKCPEGYVCERKQCTKQYKTTAVSTRLSALWIIYGAMLICLYLA